MTKPYIARCNSLTQLDNGVWVKSDEADRSFIDYTDGDSIESSVYTRVEAASDRSVFSEELDRAWTDWALEYHLSSKRSNVYRGLNLKDARNVLEVGCGCGAISRFLGEQGFRVDAIEGSLRRAEIARLRTSDLENVQIISSNYHQLELPAGHYDLVIFTGVLEYSGAYAPQGVLPEEQLALTLQSAQATLNDNGLVLIAIENRTGFKYLAGANEDHLSLQNIGLSAYPELKSRSVTRGIRTWSKSEWSAILDKLEFAAYEFCYPFPDYKIPDAIVAENFIDSARYPEQVIGGIQSRDYAAMWEPGVAESLFWQVAGQTGSLDKFANSFLIVAGSSGERISQTIDFDFVRFASVTRKPPYRLQVMKKPGEDIVHRSRVVPGNDGPKDIISHHHIPREDFVDGQVLDQVWVQALRILPSYVELAEHIKIYHVWLKKLLTGGAKTYVDALPGNIIVDDQNAWHLIDQEWHAVDSISEEIILFRALFHFVQKNRGVFSELDMQAARVDGLSHSYGKGLTLIETLDNFVRWGFSVCDIDYDLHRNACVNFEASVQKQVTRPEFIRALDSLLEEQVFQENFGHAVEVRAFWTQIDGVWHQDHSRPVRAAWSPGIDVELELPLMVSAHHLFRIDLSTDFNLVFRRSLSLQNLEICVLRENGDQQPVFKLGTTGELFEQARAEGLRVLEEDAFMLTSDAANMTFDLSGVNWGENIASIHLNFSIGLSDSVAATREYLWWQDELRLTTRRVRVRQNILESQGKRIEEGDKRLALLDQKIMRSSTTTLGKILAKFGLMRRHKV